MHENDIRSNVVRLIDLLDKTDELSESKGKRLLGELIGNVLVDISRAADALDRLAPKV